jgi:hypothetical protein
MSNTQINHSQIHLRGRPLTTVLTTNMSYPFVKNTPVW